MSLLISPMLNLGYFLIPLLLGFSFTLVDAQSECGTKGIHCVSATTYQNCWYSDVGVEYGTETYTCAAGTTCDQEVGDTLCIAGATTPTTTQATTTTARPDSCGSKGIHCFNATTYRACYNFWGLPIYTGDYVLCAAGTTCDENTGTENCVSDSATTTTQATTTTTQATTTTTTQATTTTTTQATTTPTTTAATTTTTTPTTTTPTTTTPTTTTPTTTTPTTTTPTTTTPTTTTPTTTTPTTTTPTTTTPTTTTPTTTTPTTTTPTTTPTTTTPTTTTPTTTTPTTTTPTTTTEATTTEAAVTAPASCNVDGERWPGQACNQYYQCYLSTWNYYVVDRSCNAGERYDSATKACVADSTCNP